MHKTWPPISEAAPTPVEVPNKPMLALEPHSKWDTSCAQTRGRTMALGQSLAECAALLLDLLTCEANWQLNVTVSRSSGAHTQVGPQPKFAAPDFALQPPVSTLQFRRLDLLLAFRDGFLDTRWEPIRIRALGDQMHRACPVF